ncbi:MAG: hypothetical protein EOP20_06535 [Hyphomicrobiales bacterium]|nr:MAG: hypothetical protein EOP20_06535 [Hyphomicrobiales bacterium]
MKIWMVVLGIIALLVVAGIVTAQRGLSYIEEESTRLEALADDTATAVTASWTPEDFKPFAWTGYYEKLSKDDFAIWDTFKVLGARTGLEACKLLALNISNGLGNARAECAATFEKGAADVLVTMSNHSGEWRVTGLNVQL